VHSRLMTRIRGDRTAIYSTAVIQGATLVTFAAYTGVLIDKDGYDLSVAQYGYLFIPQALAVIAATLVLAIIGSRFHTGRVYLAGLGFSLAGMALLVETAWAETLPVSYPLLLASTACVGAGFGLSFAALHSYAVGLNPLRARRQILLINAFLAGGMVAAPVYARILVGTTVWLSLPVLLGVLLVVEMLRSPSLRMPPEGAATLPAHRNVPAKFRLYPGLALLYAICAVICVTVPHLRIGSVSHLHLTFASTVEAAFWAALVVGGRVMFAIIDGMKAWRAASIAPFIIVSVAIAIGILASRYDVAETGIYLLAAIACAALLPINARPDAEHIEILPLAVTGGIVALFPIGLGLSRFGYDAVARGGVTPMEVFMVLAVIGAASCIALWPIVQSWPPMAYFDRHNARESLTAGRRTSP
jgi:hypothetical protein